MASASTQCADRYLFDAEQHFDNYDKTSLNKQVVFAVDSNNNSYTNGQVVIDTTNQLGGNNGAASLKEGYIIAPYIVTAKNGSAAASLALNALSIGLKANVGNVLDRADISINGKSVVAGQNYSNMWNNIRLQYDTATSYATKMAGTNLLYPDDIFATYTNLATTANGDGYANNQVNPAVTLSVTATGCPYPFNSGLFKRLTCAINTVVGSGNNLGWPSQTAAKVQNNMTQNGKSYFIPGVVTASTINGTWIYFIKLQLIDIHPVFQELDLVCNPQVRLTLYFNVGSCYLNSATASQNSLASVTLTGGNTTPIIFTSANTSNPNAGVFPAAATSNSLQIAWGVVNNVLQNGGSYLPYQQTRLYLPFYQLTPDHMKSIIDRPVQKKIYNDVYIQQFTGQATTNGQTFTLAVQSTLPNIQYICLLPFVSAAASTFATATGINQFASIYDSAPFTTAYGAGIYNLQCNVGSTPLFPSPVSYDWNMFIDEVSNIFAVNGGNTRDIGNGLIDEIKWTNAYKSWIMDASRISSDIRQNVTITGQLQSDQALDFYVLIVYRRSFNLNRITSELTDQMN
jgi:hypothetical protein